MKTKVFTLLIFFSLSISSMASASWTGVSGTASDCAQLLVVGVGLISAGCLLRERKTSREESKQVCKSTESRSVFDINCLKSS